MWLAFFFESLVTYFPRCRKQCYIFLQENILKRCYSRSWSSATYNRTTSHYNSFRCSRIYPSISPNYVFLKARRELISIMTFRMDLATFTPPFGCRLKSCFYLILPSVLTRPSRVSLPITTSEVENVFPKRLGLRSIHPRQTTELFRLSFICLFC